MSFPSIYLAFVFTILSISSASDIPVSVQGKESNVTSVTSVFLPPSLSGQHTKEASETLSDEPSFIEYHQMDGPSKLLDAMQGDYDKLKVEVAEKKAAYIQAKKEFDLQKKEDDKELDKMAEIVEKRKELEKKLEEEQTKLDQMKAENEKEESDLNAEEEKIAELQKRKRDIESKENELKSSMSVLSELETEVKKKLGKCIEVPQTLKDFWGEDSHPDIRLCIRNALVWD